MKFKIEMTGPCRGKVWIDDKEMTGVKSVSFRAGCDEITEVTLTMTANQLEATAGEIEVTAIGDTERRFAKAGA